MLRIAFLLSVVLFPPLAWSRESIDRTPDFQIYQEDPRLTALFGTNGANMLCWPSSLAHRMVSFQKFGNPLLSRIPLGHDPEPAVRKFVQLCRTSLNGGTSQKRKLPCIRQFLKEAGLIPWAYAIGEAATEFPPGSRLKDFKREVRVEDLRRYLQEDYGVILHIGWLRFDSKKKSWTERGSHSLNAYGYDYEPSWGKDRIVLTVSNPGIDYSKRESGKMSDSVEVTRLEREPGVRYLELVDLVVSGPGFDRKDRLAAIRNIYLFRPER